MKAVVTSFSMSLSQAERIGKHLRGIKNRSAWIVDAILKKIKGYEGFTIEDADYQMLLIEIKHRAETPDHLKVLIQAELNSL